jgi:hypothetical protein
MTGDEGAATGPELPAPRRRDLDALRLVAVLLLFVFHTAKVFDADPAYHVKQEPALAGASALSWWIRRWQMPLLFLISGWASAIAAGRLGVSAFLRGRLVRLGLPLAAGVALLCPPIKWLELAGGRTLRPSGLRLVAPVELPPLELLARFFGRLDHFTWSHLWFLVYLLAFTVVAAPMLKLGGAALAGRPRAPRPASPIGPLQPPVVRRLTVVALLPIPLLALLEAALRPRFGDYPSLIGDWANLALFASYFALGVVLARWPPFEAALRRTRLLQAALLLVATATAAAVAEPHLRSALGGAIGWCGVAWAIAAAPAIRWPARLARGRLPRSALAIYVLHHTPLLAVAFVVTRSGLPLAWQVLLVASGAALATAVLVGLAWRWSPARRLFGLIEPSARELVRRPDPRVVS